MSCAQVIEGNWNFSLMDQVVVPFLNAAGASNSSSTIVDIETSPQWMWADAGACIPANGQGPSGPKDSSCAPAKATKDGRSNATCADATGIAQPPGDRTRCPHWGDTSVPRDPTWRELASYFARVALWYTRGGFVDEHGQAHRGGHHYDETKIIWEVWNEVNNAREHNVSVAHWLQMYDATVSSMTVGMASLALAGQHILNT